MSEREREKKSFNKSHRNVSTALLMCCVIGVTHVVPCVVTWSIVSLLSAFTANSVSVSVWVLVLQLVKLKCNALNRFAAQMWPHSFCNRTVKWQKFPLSIFFSLFCLTNQNGAFCNYREKKCVCWMGRPMHMAGTCGIGNSVCVRLTLFVLHVHLQERSITRFVCLAQRPFRFVASNELQSIRLDQFQTIPKLKQMKKFLAIAEFVHSSHLNCNEFVPHTHTHTPWPFHCFSLSLFVIFVCSVSRSLTLSLLCECMRLVSIIPTISLILTVQMESLHRKNTHTHASRTNICQLYIRFSFESTLTSAWLCKHSNKIACCVLTGCRCRLIGTKYNLTLEIHKRLIWEQIDPSIAIVELDGNVQVCIHNMCSGLIFFFRFEWYMDPFCIHPSVAANICVFMLVSIDIWQIILSV